MANITYAQVAATATGNGTMINVESYKNMIFVVSGTSTSFTLGVTASIDGETFVPYMFNAVDDGEFTFATSITATGKGYKVDCEGWKNMYIPISAIANGNLTVSYSLYDREY